MNKNPFEFVAESVDELTDRNTNNPFEELRNLSLEALSRPELPPRPLVNSNHTAPPLPNRPPPLSIRQSAIETIKSTDKTLSHQSSIERFNILKIKEPILTPTALNLNIKPPFSLNSIPINHKGSVKAMATTNKYVITVSQNIRIFYAPSGDNVITIPLGDIKPTTLCIVPCKNPNDQECYLWVGTEKGDLLEVNIQDGKITDKRAIHSSPIIAILKYRNLSLLTIDEQGALKIWNEWDSRHTLSLQSRPRGLRVNTKLCISVIYDDYLWLANGRNIEVYNLDIKATTILMKKLEFSTTIGNISKITTIRYKNQILVYTGHDDGKIVEWDTSTFERKRIIQTGIYRVTALIGIGPHYLWLGFSTGKISVFDLEPESSSLIKEFQAHTNSGIVDFCFDEKLVFNDRTFVLNSLSENGEIRLWDGFLVQDWIDSFVRKRESTFCRYNSSKVTICSWNIDSRKPSDIENGFIEQWLSLHPDPDFIVIGFQELVDLESKAVTAKSFFGLKGSKPETHSEQQLWQDFLRRAIMTTFPNAEYQMLECQQLVGLFEIIFAKESICSRVSNVEVSITKTGLGGYHGNKGGISTRLVLDDSSLCFVNCHLAAHQTQTSSRNNNIASILQETKFKSAEDYIFIRGGDGTYIQDHENCFFFGDMNYRIDLPRSKVLDYISEKNWDALHNYDQLLLQIKQNSKFGLREYLEGELLFAPTFKYNRNSHEYDSSEKMRIPAWCDRILFKGDNLQLLSYQRFESAMSDHRPIGAAFLVKTKEIEHSKYSNVTKIALESAAHYQLTRIQEFWVYWVSETFNLDYENSMQWLIGNNWNFGNM